MIRARRKAWSSALAAAAAALDGSLKTSRKLAETRFPQTSSSLRKALSWQFLLFSPVFLSLKPLYIHVVYHNIDYQHPLYKYMLSEGSYLECSLLVAKSCSTPLAADWAMGELLICLTPNLLPPAADPVTITSSRGRDLFFFLEACRSSAPPSLPLVSLYAFFIQHSNGSLHGSDSLYK